MVQIVNIELTGILWVILSFSFYIFLHWIWYWYFFFSLFDFSDSLCKRRIFVDPLALTIVSWSERCLLPDSFTLHSLQSHNACIGYWLMLRLLFQPSFWFPRRTSTLSSFALFFKFLGLLFLVVLVTPIDNHCSCNWRNHSHNDDKVEARLIFYASIFFSFLESWNVCFNLQESFFFSRFLLAILCLYFSSCFCFSFWICVCLSLSHFICLWLVFFFVFLRSFCWLICRLRWVIKAASTRSYPWFKSRQICKLCLFRWTSLTSNATLANCSLILTLCTRRTLES